MFTRVAGPEDLSKFDLFYSLTDDVKKQLYPKLQTEFYNKEEIISKEGSPFTCIHLVTNGSVTKSSKSMPHAEIIDKNKHWGSTALKKNSKVHLATYTAAEPSTVIKINLNDFKTLMPQVYQSFLQGSTVDLSEIGLSDKRTAAMEKRRSSISKKL
jgi:signal-transduction protein with cAMP-binding, CBS, and nucleotidyltransferase domain